MKSNECARIRLQRERVSARERDGKASEILNRALVSGAIVRRQDAHILYPAQINRVRPRRAINDPIGQHLTRRANLCYRHPMCFLKIEPPPPPSPTPGRKFALQSLGGKGITRRTSFASKYPSIISFDFHFEIKGRERESRGGKDSFWRV